MKHSLKILSLGVLALGLAACSSDTNDYEFTTPYNQSRTATHQQAPAPMPAPVPVIPAPAPAPVMAAPACSCDCNALTERALKAEEALQMCQESKSRVTGAFRDQLKK